MIKVRQPPWSNEKRPVISSGCQPNREASFNSHESLGKAIAAFIDAYKEKAAPFVCRKREVVGSQLKNDAEFPSSINR